MFKFVTIVLCLIVAASAGFIETHHVVHEPVVAKVGTVVHSAPSAVSHQSLTQVHSKAVVQDVVAPLLKTTVHTAPLVKTYHTAPVVHTYAAAAPLVKTYASAPVVHSVPVVHSAPLVKSVIASPIAYTLHH